MPLILKSPRLRPWQNNLSATPNTGGAGFGTSVPAPVSTNTKSGWVEIIASTNYAAFGFTLVISGDSASATVVKNLWDIGVGGAGSEQPLVLNYLHNGGGLMTSGGYAIFFPIYIPPGTRISARHQSNVASQAGRVQIFLHGIGDLPPWKAFSGAEGIGVDTATSGGLSHTPGNTGTESTWTNLGSTLARRYGAFLPLIGTGSSTTMTSLAYHVEFGINSTALTEYYFTGNNTENISIIFPSGPFYGNFETGDQMMVRAESSGTADNLEFALLGFY